MPDTEIALLLYGFGGELGNFKFFADDAAAQLVRAKKFDRSAVIVKETPDRASLVLAIDGLPIGQRIKELHIFSHSIGAGLYVGYQEPTASANRTAAMNRFLRSPQRIGYEDVLDAETGGLLTDHLIRDPLAGKQTLLKSKFAAGSTVKLWGCNSGVSGWIYTDYDTPTRNYVSDQNARADYYYWRALNTRNVPKPSIAQAIANYLGVPVYGAGRGSHIEVRHGGKWITSTKYQKVTGRLAGEPQTLRLHPDAGDYNRFVPNPGP
jgi:hypothetical protein